MGNAHVPVLLRESIEGLKINPDGIYIDGTLGRGGHSLEIAKRLDGGRLICIDRDMTAINEASERLSDYSDRITFVHDNFKNIGPVMDRLGVKFADGMLFDLGVSSPQLDDKTRGFSYMADSKLDMRMDRDETTTASDIVNGWEEERLKKLLYIYGEEKYAPVIAAEIVKSRKQKEIETTFELVEIIKKAMPAKALREKQHPAKRTFQALRIAVNDEINSITQMLETAADRLNKKGRLAVISFHSLEDRAVKAAIRSRENGCTCPPDFPVCVCGFKQTLRSVTKKPITPTEEETEANPRSRSAKLRIAERV